MCIRDRVSSGRYPYTGRLGSLQPEDQAIVERSLDVYKRQAEGCWPFPTYGDLLFGVE